jgi:hypothetical protein
LKFLWSKFPGPSMAWSTSDPLRHYNPFILPRLWWGLGQGPPSTPPACTHSGRHVALLGPWCQCIDVAQCGALGWRSCSHRQERVSVTHAHTRPAGGRGNAYQTHTAVLSLHWEPQGKPSPLLKLVCPVSGKPTVQVEQTVCSSSCGRWHNSSESLRKPPRSWILSSLGVSLSVPWPHRGPVTLAGQLTAEGSPRGAPAPTPFYLDSNEGPTI